MHLRQTAWKYRVKAEEMQTELEILKKKAAAVTNRELSENLKTVKDDMLKVQLRLKEAETQEAFSKLSCNFAVFVCI